MSEASSDHPLRRSSDIEGDYLARFSQTLGTHSTQISHLEGQFKIFSEDLTTARGEFRQGLNEVAHEIRSQAKSGAWSRGDLAGMLAAIVMIVGAGATVVGFFVSGKTDTISQVNAAQDSRIESISHTAEMRSADLQMALTKLAEMQAGQAKEIALNAQWLQDNELRRADAIKSRDAQMAVQAEQVQRDIANAIKVGEMNCQIVDLRSQLRHQNAEPQTMTFAR